MQHVGDDLDVRADRVGLGLGEDRADSRGDQLGVLLGDLGQARLRADDMRVRAGHTGEQLLNTDGSHGHPTRRRSPSTRVAAKAPWALHLDRLTQQGKALDWASAGRCRSAGRCLARRRPQPRRRRCCPQGSSTRSPTAPSHRCSRRVAPGAAGGQPARPGTVGAAPPEPIDRQRSLQERGWSICGTGRLAPCLTSRTTARCCRGCSARPAEQ